MLDLETRVSKDRDQIWDEAQIMIAKNIKYVLTQSRSYGMACIMAHQAMSQLVM